ncbi:MAG: glycoside hydrolase family 75 protein [Bacteroidia bacterium]
MKYILLPLFAVVTILGCNQKSKEPVANSEASATSSIMQVTSASEDDAISKEVAQIETPTEENPADVTIDPKEPREKPSPSSKNEKKEKAKKAKALAKKKAAAKKKKAKVKTQAKVSVPKSATPSKPIADKPVKASKPEAQTGGIFMYQKSNVGTVENVSIWKLNGTPTPVLCYKAKFSIDVDGSPRAYGPKDMGLDYTQHAGKDGNWFGIVTQPNGQPVVQGANTNTPGYYISTTALYNSEFPKESPYRYVNSEVVPYISLPKAVFNAGAQLGDMAYVYNSKTKRGAYAIVADRGPGDLIGEGSIYLAKQLGISNVNPKDEDAGVASNDILYMVFSASGKGNGKHRSLSEINEVGEKYLDKIGGIRTVYGCNLYK